MTSSVLPLFWNLASSSKDTRLTASADLISSLEGFQESFLASHPNGSSSSHDPSGQVNGDANSSEEDDEDAESGVEVDESESEEQEEIEDETARLDQELSEKNSEDVSYTVKRLVRGLASSRESSRLGFAVALTELLSRVPTITAPQVISLLVRSAPLSKGMKGTEERDMLFARLFGFNAIITSGILFTSDATLDVFQSVVDGLILLGRTKGWMRESVWWAIICVLRGLVQSKVSWKREALEAITEKVKEEKDWTQEKLAVVLLLESSSSNLDLNEVLRPTFKHTPLLSTGNLTTLARVLKEADTEEDEDSAGATSSTGSWKPQLHFVWNMIFDSYFSQSASTTNQAPFQAFFHTVVDESLFANTSSSQRRYWGFQVFQRALPLADDTIKPQLFTPNFMRCWMNNLSSSDRYLHKAALGTAKIVQDVAKTTPKVGFALMSRILGKQGRPDFDKVTKTKTVEGIMGNLSVDGVMEYVTYLQSIILGNEDSTSDAKALDDRRQWAIEQLHALCRNSTVPKDDTWVRSTLQFLLVHGFFVIRKSTKKGSVATLQHIPNPALSEESAAACRSRFFSCLVELTTFSPVRSENDEAKTASHRQQGCDENGSLWIRRTIDWYRDLVKDKHVEAMVDADEEILESRGAAYETLRTISKTSNSEEIFRGVEILLSFVLLQTYDENEDALELLEDLNNAAEKICKKGGSSSSAEEASPVDVLLDTLIALLDKGSNDLRNLASLVFGMVSSAFKRSSIEHLIAQLEQTAAEAAANASDDEIDEDEDEDEDDEEEDDGEESDGEEDSEPESENVDDEDEEMGEVDPAFRQRVADALKAAGMGVDEDASESESDADSEVWDDDQMMKVDEQLAEIFRQQHGRGSKKAEMKNQQIENMHFKTRVLDLFDTYARKQVTNPLVLDLIQPLLRLIHSAGQSERDLANKATGILRSRLGKAKDVPTLADKDKPTELLESIHEMVRKAASADLSALCSVCSIFVARSIDTSFPTSSIVRDTYQETIENFLTKKSSLVHPNFILDYLRRFPERAWPLSEEICKLLAPTQNGVNTFRKVQGYSMLQVFVQHLPHLAKSSTVDSKHIVAFVRHSSGLMCDTLEAAAAGDADWKADRLKEVVKFALALGRVSKNIEGASRGWDTERLKIIREKFDASEKTKGMKGVSQMLAQVSSLLSGAKQAQKKKQGGGKEAQSAAKTQADVNGDVSMSNGDAEVAGEKEGKRAKKFRVMDAAGEGRVKKRKSGEDLKEDRGNAKAKAVKKSKVA